MCDPEGGCTKRRIDQKQMEQKSAFAVGRAAFEALRRDQVWTRWNVQRTGDPLATFIERRHAVWLESKAMEEIRANAPKLSPLSGIRSWVYGVRYVPGTKKFDLCRFMCFCLGCKAWPRTTCSFAGLSAVVKTHVFRVNHSKLATKAQIGGFLSLQVPPVPYRPTLKLLALMQLAVPAFTWTSEDREKMAESEEEYKQTVSRRILLWLAERQKREAEKEQVRRDKEHQERAGFASVVEDIKVDVSRPTVPPVSSSSSSSSSSAIVLSADELELVAEVQRLRDLAEASQASLAPAPAAAKAKRKAAQPASVPKPPKKSKGPSMNCEEKINALCAGHEISVLFSGDGWCHGTVSKVTNKFVFVAWGNNDSPTQMSKATLARDMKLGEVQIKA